MAVDGKWIRKKGYVKYSRVEGRRQDFVSKA